jgi:hypothetical protein
MAERFLQLNLDNEAAESDDLAIKHPNAFILLYFIARRARRFLGHSDGLEPGMAKIGDWENMGLSRQNYRTALKVLVVKRFLQIIETNRNRKKSTTGSTTEGTLVKLLDSRVWDINIETHNHRNNHCLTTAQPLPNHEQEGIRKNKKEKEEQNIAQPATPLRKNDVIFFSFENRRFENISFSDLSTWKELYPAISIETEILRMTEWCLSNEQKSRSKKLWRKFITNWLSRANESAINKSASKTIPFQNFSIDRRTKDANGNAVSSIHEGRF